jgi:hypothetical protein
MSRPTRAGLVLLGILSVLDLLAPVVTDGEHPPMPIALAVAALGVISLAMVVLAWRGARWPVWPLLVVRLVSALSALPAFFAGGVPAAAIAGAGAVVVLTLFGVVLAYPATRRPALADAR